MKFILFLCIVKSQIQVLSPQIINDDDNNNRHLVMGAGLAPKGMLGNNVADADKKVSQTYPFLGVSYLIQNPPYTNIKLVPYIEADNNTNQGKTVMSNVVITNPAFKKMIV